MFNPNANIANALSRRPENGASVFGAPSVSDPNAVRRGHVSVTPVGQQLGASYKPPVVASGPREPGQSRAEYAMGRRDSLPAGFGTGSGSQGGSFQPQQSSVPVVYHQQAATTPQVGIKPGVAPTQSQIGAVDASKPMPVPPGTAQELQQKMMQQRAQSAPAQQQAAAAPPVAQQVAAQTYQPPPAPGAYQSSPMQFPAQQVAAQTYQQPAPHPWGGRGGWGGWGGGWGGGWLPQAQPQAQMSPTPWGSRRAAWGQQQAQGAGWMPNAQPTPFAGWNMQPNSGPSPLANQQLMHALAMMFNGGGGW